MKKFLPEYIRAVGIIALFSFALIVPQWLTRSFVLGADSLFHYNRFYETAMQIRQFNFSYFISIFGFQQSARVVNALYGPLFAYIQGFLVLVSRSWFGYQLLSRFLIGLIAGSSMYSLLKEVSVKHRTAIALSLFYVTTFSIQYWTMRQGFTSWGAALLPFCLIPAFRFVIKKEINPIQLAVAVGIMLQVHLLSAVFLILMYIPFFLYGFFISQEKWRVLRQGLLAVAINVILSANIWYALFMLRSENKLLDPFVNHTMYRNTINQGSKFWLATPASLWILMIIQVVVMVVMWRKLLGWQRVLHLTYLGFVFLATSFFPWKDLIASKSTVAMLIQFPFRFFVPATILLILIIGLASARVKKEWLVYSIVACLAILGAIQVTTSFSQAANRAKQDQYVLAPSKHVHTRGSYQEQYDSVFSSDLSQLLHLVEKSTPDYLPIYGDISKTNNYDAYKEGVIDDHGVVKDTNVESGLTLTWRSKEGGQTALPIVVYKRTTLQLNGRPLSSKDYRLSAYGMPIVNSHPGINELVVNFKIPIAFIVVLSGTVFTWLSVIFYWVLNRFTDWNFQILLSK